MTYDAFISYRHRPVDMAVARKLVQLLERMTGPDGRKLHIFRDREELPTEADLGTAIRRGLEESRFLIVVCSPDYRESRWCMEELRYFRRLHGNSNAHVLPILVSGEPEDVFPEELCWEERKLLHEDGSEKTVRVALEPLGADVRADSDFSRMRLLRTEYLRLAAPILGKTFDQLYQRARRRTRRLITAVVSAVIVGLTAFSAYNMNMLSRIEQEHMAMLSNESHRLSVASQECLVSGDSRKAMLLALEALPKDLENPERPLVPEAETALRSAVYTQMAYRQTGILEPVAVIREKSFAGFYANRTKVAVFDREWIYLYDTANGMLLAQYPSSYNDPAAINGEGTLFANCHKDGVLDGKTLYTLELWDAETQTVLYTASVPSDREVHPVWDPVEDLWYFYAGHPYYAGDGETILAVVRSDGTPVPEKTMAEAEWKQMKENALAVHNARAQELVWNPDYTSGEGAVTVLGKRYEALIQEVLPYDWKDQSPEDVSWKDPYWKAYVDPGETVILLQNSRGSDSGTTKVIPLWEDKALRSGAGISVEGACRLDPESGLLYAIDMDGLLIYRYRPENRETTQKTDGWSFSSADMLSEDGTLCLTDTLWAASYHEQGQPGRLAIWATEDLAQPLLALEYLHYHVTPDLRYVFAETGGGQLRLWSTEAGLLLELPAQASVVQVCVSADGSLLAVAYREGFVQVFDSTGRELCRFDCPVTREESWLNHMEFECTRLLVTGGGWHEEDEWSRIVDTTGEKQILELPDGCTAGTWSYQFMSDSYLTSDGLLLCGSNSFAEGLGAVYDLETGECVFQNECWFQYDEGSGTLLYIPTSVYEGDSQVLHGARRGEDGIFRDVYTLRIRDDFATFGETVRSLDSSYFLLTAGGYDVYSMETGEPVVYVPAFGNVTPGGIYRMVNGKIVDLAYHNGKGLTTYPLMDTAALVALAKEYLTSPLGTRQLTAAEKAEYFIE